MNQKRKNNRSKKETKADAQKKSTKYKRKFFSELTAVLNYLCVEHFGTSSIFVLALGFIGFAIQAHFPTVTPNRWGIFGLLIVACFVMLAGIRVLLKRPANESDLLSQNPHAFIDVVPTQMRNFSIGDKTTITVTIKNVSQVPAYDLKSCVVIGICPYPFPANHPFPECPPDFGSACNLNPGIEIAMLGTYVPLTQEAFFTILDGTKERLYVGGTIRWNDAAGFSCKQRFLLSIGGKELVDSRAAYLKNRENSLAWEYASTHNDVIKEIE